ncbi:MAG: helix-turn-helix domain-containing protein [Treponemataceae bacterium]|nr:helix-turn-helix domain-containing protein [Treponemataceae bacterium]
MNRMGFKENLKDELTYRDIQTKELAALTGISLHTLNHYLVQNGTSPSAENAMKIAAALGVSVEYLMSGNEAAVQPCAPPYTAEVRLLADKIARMTGRDRELVAALVHAIEDSAASFG